MSQIRFLFWTIPITLILIAAVFVMWKQGDTTGVGGLNVMDVISGAFGFLGAAFGLGVDIINFLREMLKK